MTEFSQSLRPASAELLAAVPATLAEAEELAASIERAVYRSTDGAVRGLSVRVDADGAHLHGSCQTYYCKQLAQQAAMAVSGSAPLRNCIEVR